MSDMHDHPPENDGIAGTSNGKGKSAAGNQPSSSSDDDDKKRAQVDSDLLSAWMQRLQVLTVVTAFLASMDGELFSLTALDTQIGSSVGTTARELVYACLAGALIFHICATVLGYVASFALIRYRIVDDIDEDTQVRGILSSGLGGVRPAQRFPRRIVLEPVRPLRNFVIFLLQPERLRFLPISWRQYSVSSSPAPLSLLTRCYYTTLCLTAAGFILAFTGILAYIWAGLPMTIGIFSTVCLGVSAGAGVWAIAM